MEPSRASVPLAALSQTTRLAAIRPLVAAAPDRLLTRLAQRHRDGLAPRQREGLMVPCRQPGDRNAG